MSLFTNCERDIFNDGDYCVISDVEGGPRDQGQFVNLTVSMSVDIKFELPSQPTLQVLEETDLELENCYDDDEGGGGGRDDGLDSQMASPQPTLELKDPLDLEDHLPEYESESKPEVKPKLNGTTTAAQTPILIRHPPQKLKKIKTAICTKCNVGFPSPFLFEQHMIQIHQDDRPYPCKFCGKPFAHQTELKCHQTIHDPNRFKGEPKFVCDICGKRYHIKGSMEGHRKKTHFGYKPPKNSYTGPVKEHHSTSGVKNPNPYRKPKEIHPCPHCDLTFEMKCLLQKHMTCHTKERPFSCSICQQTFPRKSTLQSHIKKVHHSATPSGMRHPRPKWQAKQPCPCTTCGKVFPTPSTLAYHNRLHTGEKPYWCPTCGERFRLKQTLNYHIKRNHIKNKIYKNPLKLFKCRICGKDDLLLFTDLNRHRQTFHRHIPFESENEKPFGCGICGKPYYLREGALICTLLGHDPTYLREPMFKHKCTECPDHFGFHNLSFLRRHWEKEHQDKQLPVQFRVAMYSQNLKADELPPSCKIDKVKKEEIEKNGPPPSQVKSECPLYTELDLLPIPENDRFFRKGVHQIVYGYQFKCTICDYQAKNSGNLGKHVENRHEKVGNMRKKEENEKYICTICGLKLARAGNLKRHMINIHGPGSSAENKAIRRVGRPRKLERENGRRIGAPIKMELDMDVDVNVKSEPLELNEDYEDEEEVPRKLSSMFKCRFCERRYPKIQPMRMHELRKHVKPWSTSSKYKKCEDPGNDNADDNFGKGGNSSVNIGDKAGIQDILNFQSVQVQLTRLVDIIKDDGDKQDDRADKGKNLVENDQLLEKLYHALDNNIGDNGDHGDESEAREEDQVPVGKMATSFGK